MIQGSNIMAILGELFNALGTIGLWMSANLSVEGVISLPALMVGFLVAIAIYNFEDSRKGLQIDAPTVISKVVGVDRVLIGIFLVSLLPIAWSSSGPINSVIPVLAIVYLFGLLILVRSLQRAFMWAKSIETGTEDSFRSQMRVQYISSLEDKEKRSAWEKIWQADESARKLLDERQLVKLFIASAKSIDDKKSYSPWLVQDFISALGTIHLDDPVIMYELVDFCLEAMLDERKTSEKQKAGELHYYMNIRRLFFQVLDKTLEQNDNSFYTLIARSREYIKNNGLSEVDFIKSFAPNFLANVEKKDDQYWIWEAFPEDWKITLEKLLDSKTKKTAFAWLNAYSRWLSGKNLYVFHTHNHKLDFKIDTITNELFPTIDTIEFSRLFAFQWSGFGLNDGESSEHAQVRNAVENQLSYGHVGHSFTTTSSDDKQFRILLRNEHEELINFVAKTTLFPSLHDKEKMSKYLKAIKELMIENKDNEDVLRRLRWLDMILRDVRKRINKLRREQINKLGDKEK